MHRGELNLSIVKLIWPGATMLAGGGSFFCSAAFISDDRLNLMLIHPAVMLGFWTVQYGGALAFVIGLIWMWNETQATPARSDVEPPT